MVEEMPVIVSRNEYGLTRIFILEDRSHGHEVPGIESRHGRMTDGIRDAFPAVAYPSAITMAWAVRKRCRP